LQKAMGTMGAGVAASQRMEDKLQEAMGKIDLQLEQFKQTEAIIVDRWNRCTERSTSYTPNVSTGSHGRVGPVFHDANPMGFDDIGGDHFSRVESADDSVGMDNNREDTSYSDNGLPAVFSPTSRPSPGINGINGFCLDPGANCIMDGLGLLGSPDRCIERRQNKGHDIIRDSDGNCRYPQTLIKGFEMERPLSRPARSATDGSDSVGRPGSQFESHTPFETQPAPWDNRPLDVQSRPPSGPAKRPFQRSRSNYLHQECSARSECPSMFSVKAIETTPVLSSVLGI